MLTEKRQTKKIHKKFKITKDVKFPKKIRKTEKKTKKKKKTKIVSPNGSKYHKKIFIFLKKIKLF